MSTTNRKGPVYNPGLCRCCGSIKKCRVLNVEYEFMGQKEVYSDMFMDCFGLMLSELEGTAETERLICANCVTRLRDAHSFRVQVLLCEEKLLQASIHIHQPGDTKGDIEIKTEVIKEEVLEPEHVNDYVDNDEHADNDGDVDDGGDLDEHHDADSSDTKSVKIEAEPKQRGHSKRRVKARATTGKRDVVLRVRQLSRKLKMMEHDGQEPPPKPPEKTVRFKSMDRDDKLFHNCATIVENSYVCPFETSFSDYHCIYCRKVFTDPKELRDHTETHDPTKYKDLVRINRKIPQIDIVRIDCRLCEAKIEDLDTFKKHITSEHDKYLFPKLRNEVLQFKLTLSHLACTECNVTFGYFHALRNHMAVHFGSCICDVCGAHFFEERRLTEHQKIHKKKEEVTYPCKECGKDFKSKHGRYLHVATMHRKEPTYQCGKCDEVFFSYAMRCRHRIEVHGEKREFACEHCDKSYDNRKSWREHNRRAHLKISKHKCDICDRMFYLPCQLKEHMTTHTGERNFRCEYCGKSYPRLRALRLHMKSHSENKYRCSVCDATFTQNVSLRNHMKKQHQSLELEHLRK